MRTRPVYIFFQKNPDKKPISNVYTYVKGFLANVPKPPRPMPILGTTPGRTNPKARCRLGLENVYWDLNMSLPISTVPILTGEAAEAFVKNAKEAEAHRGSIDFSRQHAIWSGFDQRNAARIAKLKAEGKWPF